MCVCVCVCLCVWVYVCVWAGLKGLQRGVAGKEGSNFFSRGVAILQKKNKMKPEILHDKKNLNKNIFLCHNYEFKLGNFN